jgi:chromosome segregation ATPase
MLATAISLNTRSPVPVAITSKTMAYQEIINEITEQIEEITANIAQYEADITEHQEQIAQKQEMLQQFAERIAGLTQLRVNAQTLSDEAQNHNINLNINVTSNGDSAFSTSTPV